MCRIQVLLSRYAKNRWIEWTARVLFASMHRSFYLLGEYAEIFMTSNFIGQEFSKITWVTYQYHYAAYTTSAIVTKGVATNQVSVVLEGTIIIFPRADEAHASLEHGVLRHGLPALVSSKPILEIAHNDVRCSHGSAVGDIDESSLFYLRSRGFTYSRAHMILMYAFIVDGGFSEQKIAAINLLQYE